MTEFVESTVRFPYKRSLGPVIGAFMTGLTEMRFVGIRWGDGVMVPPLEWDPATGAELAHDFVEVGPSGTVVSWCWVDRPTPAHPLDHPFAFALIELDGATTTLVHAVDTGGDPGALRTGLRVSPWWKAERHGHITDVRAFVPGEQAVVPEDDAGPASEPVTMMEYNASILYSTPVTPNEIRARTANQAGRFLGLRCPNCSRVYTGGKGYCPICALEITTADEVDLPQVGTVTNYTVITPVQYAGQTETEPFARVHVLLDGIDVVLGYQPLIDCPNDRIRVGMRVAAVWASDVEQGEGSNPMGDGNLLGWMPNGEPDRDDPSLVNRIN